MNSETKKVLPETFYFLITDAQPSEIMKLAFSTVKERKYLSYWIDFERLKLTQIQSIDIIVIDKFSGEEFDYLKRNSNEFRIISPYVIKYCDKNVCSSPFNSVPKRSFPILSQCMRGIEVTTSNFPLDKKKQIEKMVLTMSGAFSSVLHQKISCLVTDSVTTRKFHGAAEHNIPIVTVDWVEDCYKKYQYEFRRADEESILSKYRLTTLYNLYIVVSGLSIFERKAIQKLAETYGAKYSPSLQLKPILPNQILLLREQVGEKYKYAKKHNIPCLRIEWIHDSIKKGYALPLEKYDINEKENISSPNEPSQQPSTNQQTKLEINKQASSNSSSTSSTNQQECKNLLSLADYIDKLTPEIKEKLFDDYIVHATGFEKGTLDSIKNSLRHCGAFHYNELKPSVNFVICGPEISNEKFNSIIDSGFGDRLVSVDWLIRCLTTKKLCPHGAYSVKSIQQLTLASSKANMAKILSSPNKSSPLKRFDVVNDDPDEVCRKIKLISSVVEENPKEEESIENEEQLNDEDSPPVNWSPKGSVENIFNSQDDCDKERKDLNSDESNQNKTKRSTSIDSSFSEFLNDKKTRSSNSLQNDEKINVNDEINDEELSSIEGNVEEIIINATNKSKPPLLMFSGFDPQIKEQLIKNVENILHVNVLDDILVSSDVTHFILKEPFATEKVLSAVAAGLALLKPTYIEQSMKNGQLLTNVIDFHWGLDYQNEPTQIRSIRSRLMKSALKWNEQFHKNKRKLFEDLKFLIMNNCCTTTQVTMMAYVNILRAGGANVYLIDDFHQKNDDLKSLLSTIDYALIDMKFKKRPLFDKQLYLKVIKHLLQEGKLIDYQIISKYIINGPESSIGALAVKFSLNLNLILQSIDDIYK